MTKPSELQHFIFVEFKSVILFFKNIFRHLLILCALSGAEGCNSNMCEYLGGIILPLFWDSFWYTDLWVTRNIHWIKTINWSINYIMICFSQSQTREFPWS